jgi:hypothetical protein
LNLCTEGHTASSLAAHRCILRLCSLLACRIEHEDSLVKIELQTYLSRVELSGFSRTFSSSSEESSAKTQNPPDVNFPSPTIGEHVLAMNALAEAWPGSCASRQTASVVVRAQTPLPGATSPSPCAYRIPCH